MKNNDTVLLEDAYNTISEMATRKSGYRLSKAGFSNLPSALGASKINQASVGKGEANKIIDDRAVSGASIIFNYLNDVRNNPNDLESASEIIKTIAAYPSDREEFNVENPETGEMEEVKFSDIYEELLNLLTTDENDPNLLLKHTDPKTLQTTPGLTINEYIYGGERSGKYKGEKKPIQGRTEAHYNLFRAILEALGKNVTGLGTEAKEKGLATLFFYFSKRYKVEENGEHIGYYQGGLFWATDIGKERGYYNEEILNKTGCYGFSEKGSSKLLSNLGLYNKPKRGANTSIEFNTKDIKTKSPNARLYDEQMFVYCKTIYVTDDGIITQKMFDKSARRCPRYDGEPLFMSIPYGMNKFDDCTEFTGSDITSIKHRLFSDEAKDAFESIYPREEYPQLYKKGKIPAEISGERPDSAEVSPPTETAQQEPPKLEESFNNFYYKKGMPNFASFFEEYDDMGGFDTESESDLDSTSESEAGEGEEESSSEEGGEEGGEISENFRSALAGAAMTGLAAVGGLQGADTEVKAPVENTDNAIKHFFPARVAIHNAIAKREQPPEQALNTVLRVDKSEARYMAITMLQVGMPLPKILKAAFPTLEKEWKEASRNPI